LAKERAAEQVGVSPEHESVLERPDPVDKLVEAIRAIAKEKSSAEPKGCKLLDEIMARLQTEGRTLRSHSARMCHAADDDDDPLYAFNAASILTGEPQSHEEALQSPDAEKWKQAMIDELRHWSRMVRGNWWRLHLVSISRTVGGTTSSSMMRLGLCRDSRPGMWLRDLVLGVDYFDTYAPLAKLWTLLSFNWFRNWL